MAADPQSAVIAVYYGGQAVVALIWFMGRWSHMDVADPARRALIEQIGIIFRSLLAPALQVIIVLGLGLLVIHGKALWAMCWLRLKLLILLPTIPAAHFFMSSQIGQLRQATIEGQQNHPAELRFTIGLLIVFTISTAGILIGRLKPRLAKRKQDD